MSGHVQRIKVSSMCALIRILCGRRSSAGFADPNAVLETTLHETLGFHPLVDSEVQGPSAGGMAVQRAQALVDHSGLLVPPSG
eukprot:79240-Rhodomonas_salina.1